MNIFGFLNFAVLIESLTKKVKAFWQGIDNSTILIHNMKSKENLGGHFWELLGVILKTTYVEMIISSLCI